MSNGYETGKYVHEIMEQCMLGVLKRSISMRQSLGQLKK